VRWAVLAHAHWLPVAFYDIFGERLEPVENTWQVADFFNRSGIKALLERLREFDEVTPKSATERGTEPKEETVPSSNGNVPPTFALLCAAVRRSRNEDQRKTQNISASKSSLDAGFVPAVTPGWYERTGLTGAKSPSIEYLNPVIRHRPNRG
jgi:hypothetical protein